MLLADRKTRRRLQRQNDEEKNDDELLHGARAYYNERIQSPQEVVHAASPLDRIERPASRQHDPGATGHLSTQQYLERLDQHPVRRRWNPAGQYRPSGALRQNWRLPGIHAKSSIRPAVALIHSCSVGGWSGLFSLQRSHWNLRARRRLTRTHSRRAGIDDRQRQSQHVVDVYLRRL